MPSQGDSTMASEWVWGAEDGVFFARWTDSLEFIVRVQRLDGVCAVVMEPVFGKGNQVF